MWFGGFIREPSGKYAMQRKSTSDFPATPLPQRRPFEKITEGGSDLAVGCWASIPVAAGMVVWPYVGLPLGAIAAIGACWRVFGLLPVAWRELPGVQTSGWVRIWMLLAVGGTLIGALAMAATLFATFGAELPWSGALRDLWRTVTLIELLTAVVWVAGEALDRDSRWATVLMGVAGMALVLSAGLQVLVQMAPDALLQSRPMAVLLILLITGSGVLAVLLVADGASRVMASLCSDSLEAESGPAPRRDTNS